MAQQKMSILVLVMGHSRFYSRSMRITSRRTSIAVFTVCAFVVTSRLAPRLAGLGQAASPSQSRIALSRTLPAMDGREIRVKIAEVTYAPGGANSAHTHPCPVVGY